MSCVVRSAVCAVLVVVTWGGVSPAAFYADDASKAAYNDGWQIGDDGDGAGGFGPWTISLSSTDASNSNAFIGSSTSNGDGADDGATGGIANDGDSNTAGRAWGLYAITNHSASAVRSMPALMQVGDALTLRMDNGLISSGGRVGIRLLNQSNQERLNVEFVGGQANYQHVNDGVGFFSVPFGTEGLSIAMSMMANEMMRVTLTRADGMTDTEILSLRHGLGSVLAGTGVWNIGVYNISAGSGVTRQAFFNSMTYASVPEAGAAMIWAGVLAICGLVRRRH